MRGQPFVYQQMPTAEQQQPSILDPARLEAFRKNWEYYKMWNPQVSKMALMHLGRSQSSDQCFPKTKYYHTIIPFIRKKKISDLATQ